METYITDEDTLANKCIESLRSILRETARPAAVFDVDDTLIINHDTDDEKCRVYEPMKEVVDFLKSQGVALFIITARRRSEKSVCFLKGQLQACGYDMDDFEQPLYLVTSEYDTFSPGVFKYKARRHIAKDHTIVFCAGDSWTDHTIVFDEDDAEEAMVDVDWSHTQNEAALFEVAEDHQIVLFDKHTGHCPHGWSELYVKLKRRP